MYVAVDMKALRFLPMAHPDVNTLTNLVWLEQPVEDEIWMFDIYDHTAFNGFSAYQQSKLYCNTVGVDKAPRFGEPLCRLLVELASRVPSRDDVQPVRLNMQCEKVPEQYAGSYLYDPTGYKALKKPDLWERKPVSLQVAENESAVVAAARLTRPAKPKPAPVQPVTANAPLTPPTAAASGVTQPWLAKPPAPATVSQGPVASGIKKPWEK